MLLTRTPSPALARFVARLWLCDEPAAPAGLDRERVLPGRTVQLLVRLDEPLRVFDQVDAAQAREIGYAVVVGARSTPYVRDTSKAQRSVGVRLHPEAAEIIFGAPSDDLAERHTPLEEIWGSAATESLRERLLATPDPHRQLGVFEAMILARGSARASVSPVVSRATKRLAAGFSVRDVVVESGFSALFRRAVGLSPKVYARVLRFRRSLDILAEQRLARDKRRPLLARAAIEAGYADQAHFAREFRSLSGLSPSEYERVAPLWPAHAAVAPQR
jgi:hypothetical protein